jgi:hypothetical protein
MSNSIVEKNRGPDAEWAFAAGVGLLLLLTAAGAGAHIWISFSPDLKHWGDHRV